MLKKLLHYFQNDQIYKATYLFDLYKNIISINLKLKMPSPIQLANYQRKQAPYHLDRFIKDLIIARKHKLIKVEKPVINLAVSDQAWFDPNKNKNKSNFFQTEQQQMENKSRMNKILIKTQIDDHKIWQLPPQSISFVQQSNQNFAKRKNNLQKNVLNSKSIQPISLKVPFKQIKRKIIKKVQSQTVNPQKQRNIQKKYTKYLINYLHKNNLLLISKNIPPNLSVLETVDDGDYLPDGQRKQYPHYSNVIQPVQLPTPKNSVKIIRQPIKFQPRQHVFSVEQNTVFKVRHIYILIEQLFQQSIKICQTIRQMNFRGDDSLRMENQNHNFQKIGQKMGLNFKTCKLMYDILNDHYDIEKQLSLGKSDDSKLRACKQLIHLSKDQISQFYKNLQNVQKKGVTYSNYIPVDQYYLSLKDLKQIFIQVYHKEK